MRTLVLMTDGYGGHGGIAQYNRDLLTALAAYPECEEVVALPRHRDGWAGQLPHKLYIVTRSTGSVTRYLAALVALLIRDARYDLVMCCHLNLAPFARLSGLATRLPVLCMIYGIDSWQGCRRRITSRVVPRLDRFLSISAITRDRFTAWSGVPLMKVSCLPPCVHLNRYEPGPPNPTLVGRYELAGRQVVMSLCRLDARERYKGIDEILEVMPRLIDAVPNLAYLIAGDGSDRARLEAKACELGVADRTIFTGYVDEAEKVDHYRLADAFVLAGWGEGFGIVLLEAMACGVPVVASKIDGSREAVRDGALGILVDPRNSQELTNGIVAALERPKGVVPAELEYFSYANFERRLHAIVDQVLAERRR